MPAHLAERDEALLAFVPQYQSHTPETLKQGEPADAVEVRVVAQPYHRGDESRDGDVGRAGAEPELPTAAHEADRQPMLHDEQIGRAQAEHDDRVPVEPITQPTPS